MDNMKGVENCGCSSSNGNCDCYWKQQYHVLQEKFSSYKIQVGGDLEKVVQMEDRMERLKDNVREAEEKLQREQMLLKKKQDLLEIDINESFTKGYKQGMETAVEQSKTSVVNKKLLETQQKELEEVRYRNDSQIAILERENSYLKTKNAELEKRIFVIQSEAEEMVLAYQESKRKAEKEYEMLYKESQQAHESTTEHCKKIMALCKQMESEAAQRELYYREEINKLHIFFRQTLHEIESKFSKQLNALLSKFQDATAEFEKKFVLAQAKNSTKNGKEKLDLNLTENDFKSKCIVGQAGEALENFFNDRKRALDESIMHDLEDMLKQVTNEQEGKVQEKQEEIGLLEDQDGRKPWNEKGNSKSVVVAATANKEQIYAFTKGIIQLFDDFMLSIEARRNVKKDSETYFDYCASLTNMKQVIDVEPGPMDFSEAEVIFKILLDDLKSWKKNVEDHMSSLMDRVSYLEQHLQIEKVARAHEKEANKKKCHVYKALIFKLRLKIDQTLKEHQDKQSLSNVKPEVVDKSVNPLAVNQSDNAVAVNQPVNPETMNELVQTKVDNQSDYAAVVSVSKLLESFEIFENILDKAEETVSEIEILDAKAGMKKIGMKPEIKKDSTDRVETLDLKSQPLVASVVPVPAPHSYSSRASRSCSTAGTASYSRSISSNSTFEKYNSNTNSP